MAREEPGKDVVTQFQAMASPCVLLVDTDDAASGVLAGEAVTREALRIEAKYSRYRPSVVTTINQSNGHAVEVDAETADLIDYAVTCYQLSDGRFDITSGVLRRVWRFDGTGTAPEEPAVRQVLQFVGWHRAV